MAIQNELTFQLLDQFSEAVNLGRVNADDLPDFQSIRLGPQLELRQLQRQYDSLLRLSADWGRNCEFRALLENLDQGETRWNVRTGRQIGYMRALYASANIDDWTGFSQNAKRAAVSSGLTSDLAGQIVSALDELLSNVIEHSRLPSSGYVAFAQGDGLFEIVVVDEGIGVLKSLSSNEDYAHLVDHGDALQRFIKDGVSRLREAGRGKGFRPLFTGLANAHCTIRFRSGDYALEIDGRKLSEAPAELRQVTAIRGLFCSVTCHFSKPKR